ncbi:BON domain-containing protein [Psychroserpens luteus]|uniref:BON domain-containing protein n=1 Tax=Psychroserpens luteus TaxID=1434066 RepID=A0ABW5ZSB4_9FLAO|nr:BON domain-containing protein [Psychroserpens luteus]
MKNDAELRADVLTAIKLEPLLHFTEIEVAAKSGFVLLTGKVDSYIKKMEAQNAAKKVIGVKVLIEKIKVKIQSKWMKTDSEIVKKISKALKRTWTLPKDKITVKVENGWVTLDGKFDWNYQREAAKKAVHFLYGVRGVTNNIKIKSKSDDSIELKDIEKALRINVIDDSGINVNLLGTTVKLSGTVISWYQRDEAERIVWNTPSICNVHNELKIEYIHELVS